MSSSVGVHNLAEHTGKHPNVSVRMATMLIVFITAMPGCVFEERGICIRNASAFAVIAIRLSNCEGRDYVIGINKALKPGETISYYWVDYGTYAFYTVDAIGPDEAEVVYTFDMTESPFTVSYGALPVLIIENPVELSSASIALHENIDVLAAWTSREVFLLRIFTWAIRWRRISKLPNVQPIHAQNRTGTAR